MPFTISITTTTYKTGSASTSSTSKNEIDLSRPRGVYTDEYHSKRRSRDSSNSATGQYIIEHHRQSLSRAAKAILKSEEADMKAKAPKALSLQDWIPLPSPLATPSTSMEDLCMEFARLATELQNGWTEYKKT